MNLILLFGISLVAEALAHSCVCVYVRVCMCVCAPPTWFFRALRLMLGALVGVVLLGVELAEVGSSTPLS